MALAEIVVIWFLPLLTRVTHMHKITSFWNCFNMTFFALFAHKDIATCHVMLKCKNLVIPKNIFVCGQLLVRLRTVLPRMRKKYVLKQNVGPVALSSCESDACCLYFFEPSFFVFDITIERILSLNSFCASTMLRISDRLYLSLVPNNIQ